MSEKLTFEDYAAKVEYWAAQKGILEHSRPSVQLLKAMSELGELADAEIKNDREGCIDGLGDVLVCLIIYARMNGLDIVECLGTA
jgi:NTP pyrophosphatase (non-canonical NTP hydrolase)